MDLDTIDHFELEYVAAEVDEWRYSLAARFAEKSTTRTGWACDLCQCDRRVPYRASVCYVDLLLYRKKATLPFTLIACNAIADLMRFEDKNICGYCELYVYWERID